MDQTHRPGRIKATKIKTRSMKMTARKKRKPKKREKIISTCRLGKGGMGLVFIKKYSLSKEATTSLGGLSLKWAGMRMKMYGHHISILNGLLKSGILII